MTPRHRPGSAPAAAGIGSPAAVGSERRAGSTPSRSVPGVGGAPSDERTADGQQALRLHAGISVVAFVLSAFVCGIFVWLASPVLAVVFGVLALACLGVLGWAIARRRRGRRDRVRPRA